MKQVKRILSAVLCFAILFGTAQIGVFAAAETEPERESVAGTVQAPDANGSLDADNADGGADPTADPVSEEDGAMIDLLPENGVMQLSLASAERPLRDIIDMDGQMYTTIYDDAAPRRIVDTNDPSLQKDAYYEKDENGKIGTVDPGQVLYVEFRMARIEPHDDDRGVQEGITYTLPLPDVLVPAEKDENGNIIRNPADDELLDFIRVAGELTAQGGIFGDDENGYTLKMVFGNVEGRTDISGSFRYGTTVSPNVTPGSECIVEDLPGGSLSFQVTPSTEQPDPEDYTLDLSIADPPRLVQYGEYFDYVFTATITDNTEVNDGESHTLPYRNLTIDAGKGWGFTANLISSSNYAAIFSKRTKISVTLSDGSTAVLDYVSASPNAARRSIEGWYYDEKSQLKVIVQFLLDEAIYHPNDYMLITPVAHVVIGKSDNGGPSADGMENAENIRSISIEIPAEVYDDYQYAKESITYSASATLSGAADSAAYPDLAAKSSKTVTYQFGGDESNSFFESPGSGNWSYLHNLWDVYSTTIYTISTNDYAGNYFWFEFDPAVVNTTDANYYTSNASFSESGSMSLTDRSYTSTSRTYNKEAATFRTFSLSGRTGTGTDATWTPVKLTVRDIRNSPNNSALMAGGGVCDLKMWYQLQQVFADAKDSDALIAYCTPLDGNGGKYAWIFIDPDTEEKATNSIALGKNGTGSSASKWCEYLDATAKEVQSAKAPKWRIHVFNIPYTNVQTSFDQMMGNFIADDTEETRSTTRTDRLNIGVYGYDSDDPVCKKEVTMDADHGGVNREQASYMSGTWVDDETILWQFEFDAQYWYNQVNSIVYIQPGENLSMLSSGSSVVDGQSLYCNTIYEKQRKNGSWSWTGIGLANTPYNGETDATIYDWTKNTTLSSDRNIYGGGWSNPLDGASARANDQHMATIGFFTHVDGSSGKDPEEYACTVEIVERFGDITWRKENYTSERGGDGQKTQYPIKIKATGYLLSPDLAKSGKVVPSDGDRTAAEWALAFSGYKRAVEYDRDSKKNVYTVTQEDDYVGSSHANNVSAARFFGYYGFYSGVLTVTDTMAGAAAKDMNGDDVDVKPGKFIHVTKMFSEKWSVNSKKYNSTTVTDAGAVPYADTSAEGGFTGDTGWQKYTGSSWQTMGAGCLWDPAAPGIYKHAIASGAEVYVYYAGDMVSSVEDKLEAQLTALGRLPAKGSAYSQPLVVEYRGLTHVETITPIHYVTELDNAAFCAAAAAESGKDEETNAAMFYDVVMQNSARVGTWHGFEKDPAATTVEKRVAAHLAIAKAATAPVEEDEETGMTGSRRGTYRLTVTNGVSSAEQITVEDYITDFTNKLDGIDRDVHSDADAVETLAKYLDIGNIKITVQTLRDPDPVTIYENGSFTADWKGSKIEMFPDVAYDTEHPGSLFRILLQTTANGGRIEAGMAFTVTYSADLQMDVEKDGETFRNSAYYQGGNLWINNNAEATRDYQPLDVNKIAALSGTPNASVDSENHTLTVDCGGSSGTEYLDDEEVRKSAGRGLVTDKTPWMLWDWTGSMGRTKPAVSLEDAIGFDFSELYYYDPVTSEKVNVMELEEARREEIISTLKNIIRENFIFSNFKVYHTDVFPKEIENMADLTPVWDLGDFSFRCSDEIREIPGPEDLAGGVELKLTTTHSGFRLEGAHLDFEKYLVCTYDVEVDWQSVYKTAMEQLGFDAFSPKGKFDNAVSTKSGKSATGSSNEISVAQIALSKALTDSDPTAGTAGWKVEASTLSSADDMLEITDTIAVKKAASDGDGRVQKAAEAAAAIAADSVKITLGDETIYENGAVVAEGWKTENVTVTVEGRTLHVTIRNTADSTVLGSDQTYTVTYDSAFDITAFLANGGLPGDAYTLCNSVSMHYGGYSAYDSAEGDFKPDSSVSAEKQAGAVKGTNTDWTATAGTGWADRTNFTLTDEVTVAGDTDGAMKEALSISRLTITVTDENGNAQTYTAGTLPAGYTLTAADGSTFYRDKAGINGFKLVIDRIPANHTVTVAYSISLDRDVYIANGGKEGDTVDLNNILHVTCDDGNTAGDQADSSVSIEKSLEKTGELIYDAADPNAKPKIKWTFAVNLYSIYTDSELAKMTAVTVKDPLSPILEYVSGSGKVTDAGGNSIDDGTVSVTGRTVTVTMQNPAAHPTFILTFETTCLAGVDSVSNTASLEIDGKTVTESSTEMKDIKVAGIYGAIQSTETPVFTPEGWKYVDHKPADREGAYQFKLTETDVDGKPLADGYEEIVSNGADGHILFQDIEYKDLTGGSTWNRYYTIREIGGQDDRAFRITVTITKLSSGAYVLTSEVTEPENYANVWFDNTDDEKTTDFTVTKVWDDNDDEASLRPRSIVVDLYQNGEPYGNYSATLNAGNGWSYTWENLPVIGGEYSARERAVDGYEETDRIDPDGIFTITNSITGGSLTISKTVVGDKSDVRKRFTFTVTLKDADGNELPGLYHFVGSKSGDLRSGEQVTLGHDEYITIKNLPDGATFEISEVEADKDGYETTATIDGEETDAVTGTVDRGTLVEVAFQNKNGEDMTGSSSLTIRKTVVGEDGDTDREFHFIVTLKDALNRPLLDTYDYIRHTGFGETPGRIGSGGEIALKHGEYATITGLPDGTVYTVEEVEFNQNGYTTSADGFSGTIGTVDEPGEAEASFVNQKGEIPVLTSLCVEKKWEDGEDPDRPASVTVQLLRDGVPYEAPVTLSAANYWTCTWTDLNAKYTWSVVETGVSDGYAMTSDFETTEDGIVYTITNRKEKEPEKPEEPELTALKVTKVWEDDNDPDRPTSVTVQLLRDGSAYGGAITLQADNDWTYTWTELDKTYKWTVEETDVPEGYAMTAASRSTEDEIAYTITNKKSKPEDPVTPSQPVESDTPSDSGDPSSGKPSGGGDNENKDPSSETPDDTSAQEPADGMEDTRPDPGAEEKGDIPGTGDSSHSGLWILMIPLSLCVIFPCLYLVKRRK